MIKRLISLLCLAVMVSAGGAWAQGTREMTPEQKL